MIGKIRIRILLFLLVLIYSLAAFGQNNKQEKEIRIDRELMPENAISTLLPFLEKANRIRYYHETDGVHHSYECKFRHEGKFYSVEFTEDGRLEDVEVVIDLKELPENTSGSIVDFLKEEFSRYIIRKIQKQYTSGSGKQDDAEIIKKALENDEEKMTVRYEIEVDGKQGNNLISQELLFDQNGSFIQYRNIIRRQVDNILY